MSKMKFVCVFISRIFLDKPLIQYYPNKPHENFIMVPTCWEITLNAKDT